MTSAEALSNDLAAAVERVGRGLVAIHARRRIPSSGLHWRDGLVVTAHHTVKRDGEVPLTLPDGTRAAADVSGRDPGTDLAVLRLREDPGLPAAEGGTTRDLRVGLLVLAVGRPWDGGPTASLGIVSALGEAWRTWHGGRIDRLVRLDMTIHDGFSGGALVDAGGRVLGINSSALARGAALTLPWETVERVAGQLQEGGIRRGYLGVAAQAVRLPEALREILGREAGTGLLVVSVGRTSPAGAAGVLLGDVLVALDGEPLRHVGDLLAALESAAPDQRVSLRLFRGGELRDVEVAVGVRPEEDEEG